MYNSAGQIIKLSLDMGYNLYPKPEISKVLDLPYYSSSNRTPHPNLEHLGHGF